jgi:hypothetical protein
MPPQQKAGRHSMLCRVTHNYESKKSGATSPHSRFGEFLTRQGKQPAQGSDVPLPVLD